MKLHKRTMIVQKAGNELSSFLLDWEQKHDLTFGEVFGLMAEEIAKQAKYMRRQERHPDDPDKRGDEE